MSKKYEVADAKAYAKQHFRGLWAASLTPFNRDMSLDEAGFRANLRHWGGPLGIGGVFVTGKQGEYFSMSIPERKRTFELAAEECAGCCGTVMSCSDVNIDTVLELGEHAVAIGADWIIVHSPMLHFAHDIDETVYEYYRYLCERLPIGIALWNHPDCGYIMSPQLCARIAELPNIVAIKYSVPRAQYSELTRLAGDKIQVSTASEEEWLDNIIDLKWQLYLCSTPPILFQTAVDRRIDQYTRLAFAGKVSEARAVRDSLDPVRQAFKQSKTHGMPQSHSKYWQELIGQVGGMVRRPGLALSDAERTKIRTAFAASGLRAA
jgi:4-hydroxy-tetrahydrodipicolinate synthase